MIFLNHLFIFVPGLFFNNKPAFGKKRPLHLSVCPPPNDPTWRRADGSGLSRQFRPAVLVWKSCASAAAPPFAIDFRFRSRQSRARNRVNMCRAARRDKGTEECFWFFASSVRPAYRPACLKHTVPPRCYVFVLLSPLYFFFSRKSFSKLITKKKSDLC